MAEVLKQMYAGSIPTGATSIVTVPAAHTYTVRSIRLLNNKSTVSLVKIGINGTGDSSLVVGANMGAKTTAAPALGAVNGASSYELANCFIVLQAGDTLQAIGSASGVACVISGLDQS